MLIDEFGKGTAPQGEKIDLFSCRWDRSVPLLCNVSAEQHPLFLLLHAFNALL